MITKGKWKARKNKHGWIIEYKDDKEGFYKGLCLGVDTEANAQLIISAVNACIRLNPDNPQAAADSIGDLVEACKRARQLLQEQQDIIFGNGFVKDILELALLNKALKKVKGE